MTIRPATIADLRAIDAIYTTRLLIASPRPTRRP
jgi:hypothetical protein